MDFYRGIGKAGVAVAIVLAIAMAIVSLLFEPEEVSTLQYGLCLPSPDSWGFDKVWSWCVNLIVIAASVLLIFLINRSYNFIRTTEPALVVIFMIMATSLPWLTYSLNTSQLLCLANVVCMGIIFDTYDTRNATQEMFTIGVVAGMGSMVQYAFLPMAVVYLIWALFMKVLRVKETLAFLAGIICPYWIALGTGWLHFNDFHFPSLTPLFTYVEDPSEFIIFLAAIALAAATGFLVTCVNFIKLYAGNSRVNAMNLCVNTLGVAAVVCILVDFDNIHAYVSTLYLACAVQLANICALWNPRMPWTVSVFPALAYIGIFVCAVIF